jgi:hypothetical protein
MWSCGGKFQSREGRLAWLSRGKHYPRTNLEGVDSSGALLAAVGKERVWVRVGGVER